MNVNVGNRDMIGNLFIKLSEWEGKRYEEKEPGAFVGLIFSDTSVDLPAINDVIGNKPVLAWKSLHTGDLAVYSNGESYIFGLVMGEIERQFCFVDPKSSTVQIVDLFDDVIGYDYINGFKVIQ